MSWCCQAESSQTLHKCGDEVLWQVGGGEEEGGEVEEAGAVLHVHHLGREQLVELGVELGELEVVLRDESVDGGEREERDGAAHRVRGQQEVGEQEWAGHERNHLGRDQLRVDSTTGSTNRQKDIHTTFSCSRINTRLYCAKLILVLRMASQHC